jgi:DNA-binding MarR family transcriptional regulator
VDGADPGLRQADAERTLTEADLGCWFNLLNAHTHLTRQLDTLLQDRHHISLAEHTVLRQLILVGGHMRMSELADTVLLSPSGTSRLVDRLVADGLIVRRPCDADGRAVHAEITDRGRARAAESERTYAGALHDLFIDHFSPEEFATLSELLLKVAPACQKRQQGDPVAHP